MNVIGSSRSEEHNGAAEILRTAPSCRRDPRENRRTATGISAERSRVVRLHVPWSNTIYIHTPARPFVRERFDQLSDRTLARGIRRDMMPP